MAWSLCPQNESPITLQQRSDIKSNGWVGGTISHVVFYCFRLLVVCGLRILLGGWRVSGKWRVFVGNRGGVSPNNEVGGGEKASSTSASRSKPYVNLPLLNSSFMLNYYLFSSFSFLLNYCLPPLKVVSLRPSSPLIHRGLFLPKPPSQQHQATNQTIFQPI